jgi:hypothetical protein
VNDKGDDMSKAKFTPGPWVVDRVVSALDVCIGYEMPGAGSPVLVAMLNYDEAPPPGINYLEAKANARLIAASPDLLAACEKALHCLTGEDGPIWDSQSHREAPYHFLWAAVVKARGVT